ncbi:MAG: phytoene/squalene synthase family protein [Saprospiraceae bacterium]|nr:phytoene/squalene synthase family protein [Saprospiraceae bacterium]
MKPTSPTPASLGKTALKKASPFGHYTDHEFQSHMLQGVSRTFALTIPLLPERLEFAVSNAYLLCRIVDTIEDEPRLGFEHKKQYCEQFVQVVSGKGEAEIFSGSLLPRLSGSTKPEEKELVEQTPRVIEITKTLNETQRRAMQRCVRIMSEGMIHFQQNRSPDGLEDLAELDRYCYVVAGVVGEMLTDLFCNHSAKTAENYDEMMKLATSFGQGLQMTNILKDIHEDLERGVCWLPRSIFADSGYDLSRLKEGKKGEAFERGLIKLVGIAHGHLQNAFRYTMLIDRREKGMRRFCLLALGLAVLTLKNINDNPSFSRGAEVKISRRSVKMVYGGLKVAASRDRLLRMMFNRIRSGLPQDKP